MAKSHPIHTLRAKLDSKRLELIQTLAASNELSAQTVNELSTVQAALTAVTEAIATHGPRLGWGSEGEGELD
jgi:hypothetical protein